MTGATLTIMIKKSKYKLISNKIHKIMFKLKMINKMDNQKMKLDRNKILIKLQ